jgi:hypothetical protein
LSQLYLSFFFLLADLLGTVFFVVLANLRYHVTRLVSDGEFAVVFVGIGIIMTMGSYVMAIVTNQIYKDTVQRNPSTIFYILAALGACPLGILM